VKRSEMVEILKMELDKFDAPGNEADHQRLAEHLLYTIELFDMIPPLEPDRRVEDCDLGLPEWEPEDE
jgi:hypothetical protein